MNYLLNVHLRPACLLIIGLLALCFSAKGQVHPDSVVHHSAAVPMDTLKQHGTQYIDLNPRLLIIEDHDGKLSIDKLVQAEVIGFPQSTLAPQKPLPADKSYWAIFQVYTTYFDTTDWVLETGGLDFADLYIKDPHGTLLHKKTGRLVPNSQRDMREGDHIKPKFYVQLAGHTSYTCYVRLQNITKNPVVFDVHIYSRRDWLIKEMADAKISLWFLAFMIGSSGIMLLYNFLLYLFSRDHVYLEYSAYIFFVLLYIVNDRGLLAYTFLGEFPLGYLYTRSFSPCFGLLFYIRFMRQFLDLKSILPKWDKVALFGIYVELANFLFLLVVVPVTMDETFFRPISVFIHLVAQITVLVLFVRMLFTSSLLARYFVVGGSAFVLAAVFFAFVVATKKVPFQVGIMVQGIGIVVELVAFSLGLGYRIRLIEKERRKAQEEHANLLRNQNQTLERKVKERTIEIEKQKEEILTQNEELHQQQEEIIAQRDYIDQQNKLLKEQHAHTTDSIRYAKTIQEAILPLEGRMEEIFSEHFTIYRPKDIVSGDFYWLTQVDNRVYLAVVDCTGHGVPGAFMSIMGATLLDDIITKEGTVKPSEILEGLNYAIQFALKQGEKDGNRDGMDMILCLFENVSYNEEKRIKVTFSGAKRPLHYSEAPGAPLKTLKGDRKSVGGVQRGEKEFTDQSVILNAGAVIYLFTDGYADQHNMQNRKFGSLQLEHLIEGIKDLPLLDQKRILDTTLNEYQGDQKQRDDITLLGVKI